MDVAFFVEDEEELEELDGDEDDEEGKGKGGDGVGEEAVTEVPNMPDPVAGAVIDAKVLVPLEDSVEVVAVLFTLPVPKFDPVEPTVTLFEEPPIDVALGMLAPPDPVPLNLDFPKEPDVGMLAPPDPGLLKVEFP